MLRSMLLAGLIVVAPLVTTVAAQPLAAHLPADAVVYIGWSGADDLGPGFDDSHVKALIEMSRIDELISEVLPQAFTKLADELPDKEAQQAANFMSTVGLAFWKYPTAFYFGGLDFSGREPSPQLAIVCDAGQEAGKLRKKIDAMLEEAGPAPIPVAVRKVGSRVVLTVGTLGADQQAALGLVQTLKAVPRLSDSKVFDSAVQRTISDSVFTAYVDGERLLALIDATVAKATEQGQQQGAALPVAVLQWQKAKGALGLDGLKRACVGVGFDGRRWGTRVFVEAPTPRRGLVALLDQTPVSDGLLAAIPESSSMAGGFGFDIAGLVQTLRGLAAEFDPNAAAMFDGFLAQAAATAGFDLMEDLLKPLGSEWAFYIDEETGSSGLFGCVAVNRLRDAARFRATMTKIEEAINGIIAAQLQDEGVTIRVRSVVEDGTELHYFALPLVSPAWAVRDGNLYLGLQPQFVASAAHHSASGGKSLLDNKAFTSARKQVGAAGFGSFSFVDLHKTAPDSYSMVTMISRLFVGIGDLAGVEDTPAMVVPPMYKLKPHLTPAASFSWSDDDGFYMRSVEAFPGSSIFSVGTTNSLFSYYAMLIPAALAVGSAGTAMMEVPFPETEELQELPEFDLPRSDEAPD